MSLFGKRTADPIQGSPTQKPSPFSSSTNPLFGGSTSNNHPPPPSSTTTTTPSIFGSTQSNSIFSSTPTTSHQPNQSSNPFPANSSNPPLFGSQSNPPPTQPTPFGNTNLFGNSTQIKPSSPFGNPPPTSNLFGNSSSTPNSTNNLFGNSSINPQANHQLGTPQHHHQITTNPTTTTTTTTTTNLFGSSIQKPTPNSLFNTQSSTPTNNTFANQTSSAPLHHNPSLFNSTHHQSVFNRSAPPSTAPLNNNTPNGFSSLRSSTAQLYRRPITLSELSIQDRIIKIHTSWNVNDPQCQFQYFFYNVVPPEQVHLYGKPDQIAADDPRWQRAKRNNPDPSRLVPTLAVGFEDLTKRVSVQQRQAQIHLMKLEEISSRLNEITRKHNLETSSKLHKLKTEQVKLSTRLMGLVNKLNGIALHSTLSSGPVGSVSQPSYPYHHHHHQQQQLMMMTTTTTTTTTRNSTKEEELIERIKRIKADLERFGGKSKIAELWSTLHQIKNLGGFFVNTNSNGGGHVAVHPHHHHHHPQIGHHSTGHHHQHHAHHHSNSHLGGHHHPNGSSGGGTTFVGLSLADAGAGKWSVTDEKEIKKVLEILVNQKKGIDHLVLLLRRSRADLLLMRQAFNLESNLKTIEW